MGALWELAEADADHPGDCPADGSSPWLPPARRELVERLLADRAYPCHFGVRGQRAGWNRYTLLDERPGAAHDAAELAATLRAFRDLAWRGPSRQSLVAFVGPPRPDPALDLDTARFWALLGALGEHDTEPWPADRPRDPDDPRWQWCFAGEPWFVFGCTPAYRDRRSRDLGPCLTLVFQVRRVFEGLGGESPAGRAAKRRVRERLADYDAVGPHPHLGDPLHSSTSKWRQYMLPDDQRVLPERGCPFPAPGKGGRPA